MTKQELANYLEGVLNDDKYVFQDKSIVDMATYTLKKYLENKAQVLKADLLDVAQEVASYLAPTQEVLKPVENKLKPVEKEEPTEEPAKEKPKKSVKKASKIKELVLPKTLETDFGTLKLVRGEVHSVEELTEELDKGRELVFAVYWSKKLLRQFTYGAGDRFKDIKSFPMDFDISKPVYTMEDSSGVYSLSLYTENMGYMETDHFEEVEGLRYTGGAEWGLYEVEQIEEEEEIEEITEEE